MNNKLDKIWRNTLKKSKIGKNGRRLYKSIFFYHWTWNLYNPTNKIFHGDGYVIHHKDENPLNDNINNLQKMTREAHSRLHQTGKVYSKEIREKMSESTKGIYPSEETKEKMSKSHLGLKNAMYGKKHKKSTKDKISKIHKGRVFTEEWKNKISESHKGMYLSEETKEKIRQSHLGSKNPKAKYVMVEYQQFPSIREASKSFDVKIETLRYRIIVGWSGYYYIEKEKSKCVQD